MKVWLNIDAGETALETAELWSLAQGLSIACGGHAGDEGSMDRVLSSCARTGARAGAHPSYEDREGFGRRALAMDPGELRASIARQCARLRARADRIGVRVSYVKPHGALYHAAQSDRQVADAVVLGAKESLGPVAIVAQGGRLREATEAAGLAFLVEAFADRGVLPDGTTLIPRGEPGALVTDPLVAASNARRLMTSVDTICVHGDTPGAIAIARAVREVLGP
jgi:UPF0271 protein